MFSSTKQLLDAVVYSVTGNAVIFKPSQFTPLTAVMLAEVFTRSGLPPNCYSVLQGGHVCGDLLTKHEGVAKVTFTGSVNTGTKVSVCVLTLS